MNTTVLESDRLKLRQWKNSDLPLFAELNADPEVMRYYPRILKKKESDAMAQKIMGLIDDRGWGFWAVELKQSEDFIGFVGLHKPTHDIPCTPCVEVGWRLAKKYWGHGYASEAAKLSLDFAFNQLMLAEVFSFASVINTNSIAVMERIGMKNQYQNFDHPMVAEVSELLEHVLYKSEL